ncbi:uncharacterized protein V1516DRAFT_628505, partial [Lipomyces oligophaga]|uniref:uncharacterized protein n=1 Tax=Lipomyces oligophaga TaxID=45792 RepID=UPI0034CEEEB8
AQPAPAQQPVYPTPGSVPVQQPVYPAPTPASAPSQQPVYNPPSMQTSTAPSAAFIAAQRVAPPPPASSSAAAWTPPIVDLELEKQWYADGTQESRIITFPQFLSGHPYQYSTLISGDTKSIILSVRFPEDLSRTKFKIDCNRYDPSQVSAQRIDYPPPTRPSDADLESAATAFGEPVARWCEANVGRQVGNGECWTLAHDALVSVGALESMGYTHGVLIYKRCAGQLADPMGQNAEGTAAMVRRGDILQCKSTTFQFPGGGWKKAGNPDHTSVIVAVHASPSGELLVTALEQNSGAVRIVQQGTYDMSTFVDGEVKVYRPFWKEWIGDLDTKWP